MRCLTDVGRRLLKLRKDKDLKQNEVAKSIGISSVNLSRYEKGNRTPDQEVLHKLADFYNVKPSYIMFGEKQTYYDFLTDITENEAELLKEYLSEIRKTKKENE